MQGSYNISTPGMMSESLGPVSPPYWVLELWGDYEYALVYACVDLLITKQEYIYFFSRTSSIPSPILDSMRDYATNRSISLAAVTAVPMAGCEWDGPAAFRRSASVGSLLPSASDANHSCPSKGCSDSAECGLGCLCCQGLYCCGDGSSGAVSSEDS